MFQPEKWVLVCDTNLEHNAEQINVLKEKQINIKGVIQCSDPKYENHDACKSIPRFPSFCNVDTHMCMSGLRESEEHFNQLQKASDDIKK
jgi:hypothetical protein